MLTSNIITGITAAVLGGGLVLVLQRRTLAPGPAPGQPPPGRSTAPPAPGQPPPGQSTAPSQPPPADDAGWDKALPAAGGITKPAPQAAQTTTQTAQPGLWAGPIEGRDDGEAVRRGIWAGPPEAPAGVRAGDQVMTKGGTTTPPTKPAPWAEEY
ncbi:hypothetical protein LY474_40480 [Myxococcus stipitatus]|uniref:hypothetical protein n=1 Tax=Myxococcus stipitatus TaxID=83455 RepID=UPI001F31D792|nr:hypothetical protein [Myxococcus stipitatus]MCE9674085.1 hypothetical protein [Myxococcus stipitatus]